MWGDSTVEEMTRTTFPSLHNTPQQQQRVKHEFDDDDDSGSDTVYRVDHYGTNDTTLPSPPEHIASIPYNEQARQGMEEDKEAQHGLRQLPSSVVEEAHLSHFNKRSNLALVMPTPTQPTLASTSDEQVSAAMSCTHGSSAVADGDNMKPAYQNAASVLETDSGASSTCTISSTNQGTKGSSIFRLARRQRLTTGTTTMTPPPPPFSPPPPSTAAAKTAADGARLASTTSPSPQDTQHERGDEAHKAARLSRPASLPLEAPHEAAKFATSTSLKQLQQGESRTILDKTGETRATRSIFQRQQQPLHDVRQEKEHTSRSSSIGGVSTGGASTVEDLRARLVAEAESTQLRHQVSHLSEKKQRLEERCTEMATLLEEATARIEEVTAERDAALKKQVALRNQSSNEDTRKLMRIQEELERRIALMEQQLEAERRRHARELQTLRAAKDAEKAMLVSTSEGTISSLKNELQTKTKHVEELRSSIESREKQYQQHTLEMAKRGKADYEEAQQEAVTAVESKWQRRFTEEQRVRRTAEELKALYEIALAGTLAWVQRQVCKTVNATAPYDDTQSSAGNASYHDGTLGVSPVAGAEGIKEAVQGSLAVLLNDAAVEAAVRGSIEEATFISNPHSAQKGAAIANHTPLSNAALVTLVQLRSTTTDVLEQWTRAYTAHERATRLAITQASSAVVATMEAKHSTMEAAVARLEERLEGLVGGTQDAFIAAVSAREDVKLKATIQLEEYSNSIMELQAALQTARREGEHSRHQLRVTQGEIRRLERLVTQLRNESSLRDAVLHATECLKDMRGKVMNAVRDAVEDIQAATAESGNSLNEAFLKVIQTAALKTESRVELMRKSFWPGVASGLTHNTVAATISHAPAAVGSGGRTAGQEQPLHSHTQLDRYPANISTDRQRYIYDEMQDIITSAPFSMRTSVMNGSTTTTTTAAAMSSGSNSPGGSKTSGAQQMMMVSNSQGPALEGADTLARQLRNLCILLENNLAQTTQSFCRGRAAMKEWQSSILHSLEEVLGELRSALAMVRAPLDATLLLQERPHSSSTSSHNRPPSSRKIETPTLTHVNHDGHINSRNISVGSLLSSTQQQRALLRKPAEDKQEVMQETTLSLKNSGATRVVAVPATRGGSSSSNGGIATYPPASQHITIFSHRSDRSLRRDAERSVERGGRGGGVETPMTLEHEQEEEQDDENMMSYDVEEEDANTYDGDQRQPWRLSSSSPTYNSHQYEALRGDSYAGAKSRGESTKARIISSSLPSSRSHLRTKHNHDAELQQQQQQRYQQRQQLPPQPMRTRYSTFSEILDTTREPRLERGSTIDQDVSSSSHTDADYNREVQLDPSRYRSRMGDYASRYTNDAEDNEHVSASLRLQQSSAHEGTEPLRRSIPDISRTHTANTSMSQPFSSHVSKVSDSQGYQGQRSPPVASRDIALGRRSTAAWHAFMEAAAATEEATDRYCRRGSSAIVFGSKSDVHDTVR